MIVSGKPHTFQKESPNFNLLRKALLEERWEDIPKYLTVAKTIREWAKGSFSLSSDGDTLLFNGEPLPDGIMRRCSIMVSKGESPQPLLNFYEKLQKNPSWRSVQQLYPFLEKEGIPITEDGDFLAYKSIQENWTDHHTGTVDNRIGQKPSVPRNKVSDDPNTPCHFGLHVGALGYASTFGSGACRMVICKVDPADVVCIPYDSSQEKMRVCTYEVIGLYGGQLPSTVIRLRDEEEYVRPEDLDYEDEDYEDEDYEDDEDDDYTEDGPSLKISKTKFKNGRFRLAVKTEHLLDFENVDTVDFLDLGFDLVSDGKWLVRTVNTEDIRGLIRDVMEIDPCIYVADADAEEIPELAEKAAEKTPEVATSAEPKKRTVTTASTNYVPTQWKKDFDKMGEAELFDQKIEPLRKYASHDLKVVGAHKMLGGKPVLIQAILRARK